MSNGICNPNWTPVPAAMKLLLILLLVTPVICCPTDNYYWKNGCKYRNDVIIMCTRSLAEGEDQNLSKRLSGAESGKNILFRRETGAGAETDMERIPEA
ncbi:UNVERIFIED_CONTAM: hypothetical protein K2H54_004431 [Gekko kuhli]